MIFQNSDAFIYGYLIGLNFKRPYILGNGSKDNIYNDFGGSGKPTGVPSTGAGGPDNQSNFRGDKGKPMPTDNLPTNGDFQLAGDYGTMFAGGKGLISGTFGAGGSASIIKTQIQYVSGGGGGFYGGGSSVITAGGGGGSGFAFHLLTLPWFLPAGYPYTFISQVRTVIQECRMGVREGSGLVVIYFPSGTVKTCTYRGKAEIVPIIEKGTYMVEVYGAQGGTTLNVDPYKGGLGGYIKVTFTSKELDLTLNPALIVYVGEEGNSQTGRDAWNGGGAGGPMSTSGGGASDVRFIDDSMLDRYDPYIRNEEGEVIDGTSSWMAGLEFRFIVAGGGGGVERWFIGSEEPDEDIQNPKPEDPIFEKYTDMPIWIHMGMVAINDLSTLKMYIMYFGPDTSEDEWWFELYIDDELAETINRPVAGAKSYSEMFMFFKYLEENTPQYLAKVDIKIYTDEEFIRIPPKGISAILHTPNRQGDLNQPTEDFKKPILEYVNEESLYLRDTVLEKIEERGDIDDSIEDKFEIIDTILETIEEIEISKDEVNELFSLSDTMIEKIEVVGPEGDIEDEVDEKVKLIDVVIETIEEIEISKDIILDKFSLSDTIIEIVKTIDYEDKTESSSIKIVDEILEKMEEV